MENIDCEFCNEFEVSSINAFNKLYKTTISDRTLLESKSFKVIPTLGQLFDYSMLIVPKKHIETLSELKHSELEELVALYKLVKSRLSKFGHVIAFEHGAHSFTGGGCGIYHAHLHVIPLPQQVDLFDFYNHEYKTFNTLDEALMNSSESSEYLIAINEDEKTGYIDLTKMPGVYPSQYFRKALCNRFNLRAPWNWREYNYVENRILDAVKENILQ